MAVEDATSTCSEAGNAEEAISVAERARPDVAIVGLEITGGGVAAVEGILQVAPDTRVIVLTAVPQAGELLAVLRAGAVGYLPGTIDPAALQRVVSAVAEGEAAIPRSMVLDMAQELRLTAIGGEGLTTREAQVLGMVRRGESTAAIAERLSISPVTVRRHISTLMQKTGVASRAALATSDIRVPVKNRAVWRDPIGV